MSEFLTMMGQIFMIVCLQAIMEQFIESLNKPFLKNILNIACYAGALYLLIKFVFDNLINEIFSVFQMVL